MKTFLGALLLCAAAGAGLLAPSGTEGSAEGRVRIGPLELTGVGSPLAALGGREEPPGIVDASREPGGSIETPDPAPAPPEPCLLRLRLAPEPLG